MNGIKITGRMVYLNPCEVPERVITWCQTHQESLFNKHEDKESTSYRVQWPSKIPKIGSPNDPKRNNLKSLFSHKKAKGQQVV